MQNEYSGVAPVTQPRPPATAEASTDVVSTAVEFDYSGLVRDITDKLRKQAGLIRSASAR
jgi:hypothetical protein